MDRRPNQEIVAWKDSLCKAHSASDNMSRLKEIGSLVSSQDLFKALVSNANLENHRTSSQLTPRISNGEHGTLNPDANVHELWTDGRLHPLGDSSQSIMLFSPIRRALGDIHSYDRDVLHNSSSINRLPVSARSEASPDDSGSEPPIKERPVQDYIKNTYISVRTRHFDRVYNLLMKVFLEVKSIRPREYDLKPVEKGLFAYLMQRKFNLNAEFTKDFSALDIYQMTEMILIAASAESSKRIEERKKFVFKQVFKLIKQDFCGTTKIRFHPNNSDQFYAHYFGETVACCTHIKLEMFHDPLNPKLKNTHFKTLSNEYLRLIFQSKSFKSAFLKKMDCDAFILSYRKGMAKKLEILLDRWEKMVLFECTEEKLLQEIVRYFEFNRQCKFPWTSKEIKHALKSFENFIPKDSL